MRITYLQEQTMPLSETKPIESEQILYFKRLLVTLKAQFEEKLQVISLQLQEETAKNFSLNQELESVYQKTNNLSGNHEEELQSLKAQLLSLRDLVKTLREEGVSSNGPQDLWANEGKSLANKSLIEEVEKKNNQITILESILEEERFSHQQELEKLNQKLSFYKAQEDQHEIISSQTSSYQLRQELDYIKHTLKQEAQEAKTLEVRYADLFNDKMNLEYQLKKTNEDVTKYYETQEILSKNLEEATNLNHSLNLAIQEKEERIVNDIQIQTALSVQLKVLEERSLMISPLQEKYEQLKDEYLQNHKQLEDMLELYTHSEHQLKILQEITNKQALELDDKRLELESLFQERQNLLADIEHLHLLLEDSESNLKTAQQHLAKKVKESTLLVQQLEDQQAALNGYEQITESSQLQIQTLQMNLEEIQKQEKKLQEQLHEALKSTETQVAKWEKKYFEMYEKLQLSEAQIRDLKLLEEKHAHMQKLLSNLGNYMGPGSATNPNTQSIPHAFEQKSETEKTLDPKYLENSFKDQALSQEELAEIQNKLLKSAKFFTEN